MKKPSYIVTGIFLLMIGGISLGSLIVKDREFSPNENRYLSTAPKFSVSRVMGGEFQDNLEKYLNDQIIGRDEWITVKTAIQKMCGDTDIGGAYIGKEGYDFEKIIPEDIDQKLVNRNIDAVRKFFKKASGIVNRDNISFLLVPTSGLVMQEYLPKNAILFDQDACIEKVLKAVEGCQFIDTREILMKHAKEGVYYKTDHHWTSYGAFLAMQEWCKQTGHSFAGKDAYEMIEVSNSFRGSLFSKILDYDSAYDSIYQYKKSGDRMQYVVLADGEKIDGFYQEDKLQEKDKYAYFFGGNYGEVIITRTDGNIPEGKKHKRERNLLVIKDSFANAFVPLIADQYDRIHMVDLRYFNQDMQEYLKVNKITDILVLYNISNFVTDRNIFKIK